MTDEEREVACKAYVNAHQKCTIAQDAFNEVEARYLNARSVWRSADKNDANAAERKATYHAAAQERELARAIYDVADKRRQAAMNEYADALWVAL